MDLFADMPTGVMAIFWGVITFSLLVVVHEGGHFLAARIFGVKVHEFMIGLPGPAVRFQSRRTGIRYGVTVIPLGGYVRIAGMEPGSEDDLLGPALGLLVDSPSLDAGSLASGLGIARDRASSLLTTLEDYGAAASANEGGVPVYRPLVAREGAETDTDMLSRIRGQVYRGQKTWKRITILAMGVIFNLVVAILILTVTLSIWGIPTASRTVDLVQKGSPAARAGMKVGDTFVAVNGKPIATWDAARSVIHTSKPGDAVAFIVKRQDGRHVLTAILVDVKGTPFLGVRVSQEYVPVPLLEAFTDSMKWTGLVFVAVGRLVDPRTFVQSVRNASSVVGISYGAAEAAKEGPINYAYLFAVLSLSLGVLNILPIPPLDGGKVALEIVERLRNRPLRREVSYAFSAVGALLLFSLIFYLMYADVMRYVVNG